MVLQQLSNFKIWGFKFFWIKSKLFFCKYRYYIQHSCPSSSIPVNLQAVQAFVCQPTITLKIKVVQITLVSHFTAFPALPLPVSMNGITVMVLVCYSAAFPNPHMALLLLSSVPIQITLCVTCAISSSLSFYQALSVYPRFSTSEKVVFSFTPNRFADR